MKDAEVEEEEQSVEDDKDDTEEQLQDTEDKITETQAGDTETDGSEAETQPGDIEADKAETETQSRDTEADKAEAETQTGEAETDEAEVNTQPETTDPTDTNVENETVPEESDNESKEEQDVKSGDESDEEQDVETEDDPDEGQVAEPEDEPDEEQAVEPEDDPDEEQVTEPEADQDENLALLYPAQEFEAHSGTVKVSVKADIGAFPAETTMKVEDVDSKETLAAIEGAVDQNISRVHAVEISFFNAEGTEIEPLIPVRVTLTSEESTSTEEVKVIHVDNEGVAAEVEDVLFLEHNGEVQADFVEQRIIEESRVNPGQVVFDAEEFSIYALVYLEKHPQERKGQLSAQMITADGEGYLITVVYQADAGIPEGAELAVEEITEGSSAYDTYVANTENTLGMEEGSAGFIRLFDISIVDKDDHDIKYQPAEGTTVDVRIELTDSGSNNDLSVVHFEDENDNGSVVETSTETAAEGQVVEFQAEGFSVYAVVDAPEPVNYEPYKLSSTDEIDFGKAYLLSYGSPEKYFTSSLNGKGCLIENTDSSQAAEWYFESTDSDNTYYIYTMINGEKKYIKQENSGNNITLANEGTALELSLDAAQRFLFKHSSKNLWLQHSNGGGGIRFYTDANNKTNARIIITEAETTHPSDDPYDLNGKSFGIAYNDESVTAAAMTSESKQVSNQQRLAAKDMKIRPDVLDHEGVLLVAENSDITEWTFKNVEQDKYYITTMIDGQKKYLTVDGSNVYLSDAADEVKSVITARPGTGTTAGKWHFISSGGNALNLVGNSTNGFNAGNGSSATSWLNLVEKSVMPEEDFTLYSAKKVSVSDTENVYDAQQVIVYTRIWNDTAKKYEFYAVDHDGSLIRVYDTGDGIEWVGTKVNTALWDFYEGTNPDGTLNHFYWLQNTQYKEKCVVPQVTNGNVIYQTSNTEDVRTDFNASVNLNGRRYGQNFTTIITWDDEQYAYSGLKTENGHVVPCALSEAEDFYFAVVNPIDPDDQLSTVNTIDSTQYGITLKMINFNNAKTGTQDSPRDSIQNPFFGGDNNNPGLLSTDLANDYPTTTAVTNNAGHSLSELFTGMTDVNHLFIESIYNESGYFEYNSTSNFAHLNSDGTFTVYDQLGAIGDYNSSLGTGSHGQFMPYNDLTEGKYCTFTNRTSVLAQELSDLDARKGEKLYNIGNRRDVDYHFGMEMSASFTQTADGLDAWGHDIIFEFSGDDDFWFYVDGELVLDLGGVHSAMTGSINFRTGEVISSRGNSTLYEIFKKNYQARGLSESEITSKLQEIFEQKTVNGKSVYVFKDYSPHEMRMFYMERGAGASNLHMRFNLAAVKPGSFILSKKLSGTDNEANDLIEFPYQIWYEDSAAGNWKTISDPALVLYEGTSTPVTYAASHIPSGGTEAYENVFFLKPGQSAEVTLPDTAVDQKYYVVECGVNPSVYDHVYANNTELIGMDSGNTGRKDFRIEEDTLANRSKVDYINHVSENAMRTLQVSKILYDVDGSTILSYDEENENLKNKTLFRYRLYLGNENVPDDELPYADLYHYYIKNSLGEYCKWDSSQQKFVSLGIDTYEGLLNYFTTNNWTETQKETVIFKTSMTGTISKVPAGYSVEVRDLIVGTKWKIEERDDEIPKGYTRREHDGYTRIDSKPDVEQSTPYSGTMQENDSPFVEVRNQKGWGLTVEKIWSDKDFMETYDPVYIAVYLKEKDAAGNDTGKEIPYEGMVQRLESGETELYFFFDDLKYTSGGKEYTYHFSDFVIREVILTGGSIEVDENGMVTGYESIVPVPKGGTLTIGGKPQGGEYHSADEGYTYTVDYEVGESTGHNENIRTDKVTNSRPGIKIYKTDWVGSSFLSGAVFTLKDSGGADVAAKTYTSGADGLVTIAYLGEGTYILNEIQTPSGYAALDLPITITVEEDGQIRVSGEEGFYEYSPAGESEMAKVIVKNRTVEELTVKKVDENKQPLKGVHFALYRQVTDNNGIPRKDYLPISGYEDIETDENGMLSDITMDIGTGTYYLTETHTVSGYKKLSDDLCFTIGKDGTVSIDTEKYASWLTRTDTGSGSVSYSIIIPNSPLGITVRKTDSEGVPLTGSQFTMTELNERECWVGVGDYGLDQGLIDLTKKTEITFTGMSNGRYCLNETKAPDGYIILVSEIYFTVNDGAVSLTDEEGKSKTYDQVTLEDDNMTIIISNTPGAALPNTGGPGTRLFRILGSILIAGAGVLLWRRKRLCL